MSANKLRVACVQVRSENGKLDANLAGAAPLVAEAAQRGAKLILCPEFLAAGYIYDESIWQAGELQGGTTERWLCDQAAEHGAFVGATYLEASGDDFFNTFALADPAGNIVGRARKESLPAFEGWYFKSCDRPKILHTELGRIAVGICQDNHTARFMRRLCDSEFDLLVMPHSAPCVPTRIVSRIMKENLREIAPFYAAQFGVPALIVNKVGDGGATPIPIIPGLRVPFQFPGQSTICDSDGSTVDQLGDEQSVAVADVHLDPQRKKRPRVPSGYWSRKPSRFARLSGGAFILLELAAKRVYARNARRRDAARRISGRQN